MQFFARLLPTTPPSHIMKIEQKMKHILYIFGVVDIKNDTEMAMDERRVEKYKDMSFSGIMWYYAWVSPT